ncbi:MAG: hypothetical protein ACNA71_02780 [Kiritimatiellia bacterium]
MECWKIGKEGRQPQRSVVAIMGALFAGSVVAQVTPSFVVPVELPAVGLRILVPARSVEEPLPPLERRLYRFQQGERTWQEERYEAREIWLRSQLLGQWRDPHGNRLRILQPRYRFPSLSDAFVQRSVYDEQVAQMAGMHEPSSDEVLAWMENYLLETPGAVTPLRYLALPLQAAARVASGASHRWLYVLRLASATGQGFDVYVVDIDLVPDADVARVQQSFEERFLRSLAVFSPQPQVVAQEPALGGGDSFAMQLVRSRAEAHASVANLRNWQSVDVGDYVLLSDQRRGANQLVRDLERVLEPMRAAYAAMVPSLHPIQTVGIIRLFADQDEYVRYVGANYAWSAGLWSEARGELVIRPVDGARYQQARERVLRTIYHEAFHQYLSLATSPLRVCVWYNEGHAVLFEHSRLQRNDLFFEEHLPYVERATRMPLAELFALDYDTFYHTASERRQQHYATAWALVYYLRRTAAAEPAFPFERFLDDYMTAIQQIQSGIGVIQKLQERYDLHALEADFRDFWGSPRRRRAALRAP